jgi:alpha-beta hydrolase superfamily lysophospholipase
MRFNFVRRIALALPLLSLTFACSTSAPADDEPESADEAFTERNCIIDQPIRSDGYTEIVEADPSKVSRKRLGANGALEEDPDKVVRPTEPQVKATMSKISKFIERIENEVPAEARRNEVYSQTNRGHTPEQYCLFHKPGKAIYGTVILFHGFNDRPHQQAKLGSYLFHNGFNVYNVFLPNMFMVQGTDYWPKTVYKPELLATVQAKLAVPENQAALQPILPRIQSGALTPEDMQVIDRVLSPELSMDKLKRAWSDPESAEFKELYASYTPSGRESIPEAARKADFKAYVRDASARIAELSDMPGPIFISGLSVGGTVALAAGAAEGGRRVRGIVSHAPWLQSIDPKNNQQVMLAGPLDNLIGMMGGQYPIQWESHRINFSPASIAASLALGSWTARRENIMTLARIPTAQVITEAEDSADNVASGKVHAALTMDPRVAALHTRVAYPTSLGVRHAITDPENYRDASDGRPGSWNRYYRTLYQESFRFYTTGTMSQENLARREEDPALPKVACVMPDYPQRCSQ